VFSSQDDGAAFVPGNPASGLSALRHFNIALMNALRVPRKAIQERIGYALTGSFTLDIYGGQPEWGGINEAES